MTPNHSFVGCIELEQQLGRLHSAPQTRAAALLPQATSIDAIAARVLARDSRYLPEQCIPAALDALSLSPVFKRLRVREAEVTTRHTLH